MPPLKKKESPKSMFLHFTYHRDKSDHMIYFILVFKYMYIVIVTELYVVIIK